MATELKPVRSEADYEAALAEVERLWGTKSGTPEGDRLDVLATLIEVYEQKNHLMDPPEPIEAIKFRMEQQGLSRKDLEPIIGTRGRVAEVLNRRRGLSIEMIRNLHEQLGISAEVLIRPTRQDEAVCDGR
ncbi:MAG: transcriptional regulator [Mesorhizobium sp.]|uniref:helix-turn-helix domain-containing protein n=1 Tax=Mesorhizobium sp. TaxID=1871066 RepID=UPI00120A37C2|nr:transcriptional regulator [Mesorhizobium sp.]TIP54838.1 MAG: transcriptional regulator [Mesorhizobium sp.]